MMVDQAEDPRDNSSEFVVFVTSPRAHRFLVFAYYRLILGVDSAGANRLLSAPRVEVARGPRESVRGIIASFRDAGASIEIYPDWQEE